MDQINDIKTMYDSFGINSVVSSMNAPMLKQYVEFRFSLLNEEFTELRDAFTSDDAVDALIDIAYVAIGTLVSMEVDTKTAWDRVHSANKTKKPGTKDTRPNPFGLPDLVKPEGWIAPSHQDNVGLFGVIYGK